MLLLKKGTFRNCFLLSLCLLASRFFLLEAAFLRALFNCFFSSKSETKLSDRSHFTSFHPSSSLSAILIGLRCLRIKALRSISFSWDRSVYLFSTELKASTSFSKNCCSLRNEFNCL